MAGRKVTIPDRITRVMPYDNKTNPMLFAIAGNLMICKARAMENPNLKFISNDFLRLCEVDTHNVEEVIRLKPDFVLVAAFADEDISRYTAVSRQTGIPFVIVDLDLLKLDKSFEFLGQLLGKESEAEICANLIRNIYADAEKYKKGKKIPGKAYLANNADGLRTAPATSNHAQLFDVMNVPNAANTQLDAKGFSQVSIEQVLAWNPDYIFTIGKSESSPFRSILKSAIWRNVTAVKNKRVFYVPCEPYLWFDMPPSVNKLLGLIWFSDIFYGQPNDITKQRVKEFYKIIYKFSLTDTDYKSLFFSK
jgi:iron complex transport system substrate-binding protein